jgi:hypothetical protein
MKVFFSFCGLIAVLALFAPTNESSRHTSKSLSEAPSTTHHMAIPAPKNLAQLEHNLSQVQTQATFLNKLAQSLQHIQKFNSAVKSTKDSQTIKSLASAFQHAGTLAQSLVNTKKSLAQTLPDGGEGKQTMLAQSESMEGIISLLKKAYHIIEQIK